MRPLFLLVLALLAGTAYSGCTLANAKKTFVQKLIKLAIVFWSEANLGKITDAVIEDVRNQKTMEEIGDNGMSYVVPNTPLMDYTKLLSMMNTCDKCLQGTNTKTMDVIKLVLPVFVNQLKPIYTNIKQKTKTMQANKKTKEQQMCQAYTIATNTFTKKLVQNLITASSKKMNKQQWNCSVINLTPIIRMSLYNTKKAT